MKERDAKGAVCYE